ncbi:hypothetical protein AC249_AIPGENE19619 [Exaiptasia diaphana]|nr:hypothetical protein AC249_AIPGENE19619 [Exaiptasia diaphana]
MTRGGISAIIVIWMIYMCIPEAFGAKAIKGKRPKYGPWSACDQVCGHNGKQTRRLYCYDKKGCAGQRQEDRDCNSVNCPRMYKTKYSNLEFKKK